LLGGQVVLAQQDLRDNCSLHEEVKARSDSRTLSASQYSEHGEPADLDKGGRYLGVDARSATTLR
ncbi:MAG: hypothetical protein KDA61_06530, partial [Planctomycetales bacterium]|nr:hypothetical protein [Planctomycetales bacterium]